jgi:hypothetical protein
VRRISMVAIALAIVLASYGAGPAPARASQLKVAVIVGPVGETLTPIYLALAEAAALAAETRGAAVERAYSPHATAERVLEAVEGANIVVYLGHGVGSPNPYSSRPDAATTNGWGLNGPGAVGTHADSWQDGTLAYYGETWIAANARPAPGWVMIYSNACYAPGASEGHDTPATEEIAAARVDAYSRAPLVELGAAAYFATDFHEGAAHLVSTLLDRPDLSFGEVFASEPRFVADALTRLPNGNLEGTETWLHRSPYFEGKVDYWYAFAGDPDASVAGGADRGASAGLQTPAASGASLTDMALTRLATGRASSYAETAGWEGAATVALPAELGIGVSRDEPAWVLVCADRCVMLPVVDSCPCYAGTADQRVANLSHAAWALVSDAPLEEGLIPVDVHLEPIPVRAPSLPSASS